MQNSPIIPVSDEQQLLAAELLALVVCQLFPNAVLVGGGVNSLGFYYDFVFEQSLTPNMLELIGVHLFQFAKEEHSVRSISMMRENAKTLFEHHDHQILAEKAGDSPFNIIDLVQIGDHYGLCSVPSLTTSCDIGSVKLLDFNNFSLVFQSDEVAVTRIRGVCRNSSRDLKSFLKSYDSFLKKKDHRMLGSKLGLFSCSDSIGSLGVTWYPKGFFLQKYLIDWFKDQYREEVLEISTPTPILDDFKKDDPKAFSPFDFEGDEYCLRSSAVSQHIKFLNDSKLSCDQLPVRVYERGTFYSYVSESKRWGMFSQSSYLGEQTTICCLKEQVLPELISSLHFIEQIITIFGFEAHWVLRVSRQKTPKAKQEREAVDWLTQAMHSKARLFSCLPEMQEDEEIEGPGFELRVRDVLGREWPVSFLGFLSSVGDVSLVDQSEGKVFLLTRQILSSVDRFIALLVERYEGDFPLWLAPEQVRVLVIGQANDLYAKEVCKRLRQAGLRVKLDCRQSKLGVKVHEAETEHVPYLVLIGELERVKNTISVRTAEKFNHSQSLDVETFIKGLDFKPFCAEIE